MKRHNDKALGAQEREAYASEAYLKALNEDAGYTARLISLMAEIDAAKITVDIWRTEKATERASFA